MVEYCIGNAELSANCRCMLPLCVCPSYMNATPLPIMPNATYIDIQFQREITAIKKELDAIREALMSIATISERDFISHDKRLAAIEEQFKAGLKDGVYIVGGAATTEISPKPHAPYTVGVIEL